MADGTILSYDERQKYYRDSKNSERIQASAETSLMDKERAARLWYVQGATGLPSEIVDADLDNLYKQVKLDEFDYKNYTDKENGAPIFNEWAASDPYHPTVLERDRRNLTYIERQMRAISHGDLKGDAMLEMSRINGRRRDGDEREGDEEILEGLGSIVSAKDFGYESHLAKALLFTTEQWQLLKHTGYQGLGGAVAGAAEGTIAGYAAGAWAGPGAGITALGGAITGAGVGLSVGMFEASRELEQNLAYGEYIEQGVSKEEAKEMSGYVGAINASFELIGLRGIGKAIPGFKKLFGKNGKYLVEKMFGKPTMAGARKMVVARYGEALGTEMITEVLQESVTMLGGEILKSRDGQPYENMMTEDDWIRALTDITVQTLYGTIFIGGVGPAVSYIGDSRRAKRAQVTGAYLKGIGEGSTDLEMVKDKRLLPKVKEFFQRLGQEGPVDSIRFDTESWVEYWDSQGQDAGVVSEQFGVDLASLEAEGGDVVIDLETFGEKLAHTDHFNKELWKDAKTDAEAMTYREARDFLNNSDERIEELKAELTEAFGVEVSDDFDRIAEIVAGELVSQGNFDKKAADQQASLMASVFTTQALRNPELGFTPFDLFVKRFGGLRMDVRETAAAPGSVDLRIDPLLDTIRAGNIPDQRQIFGDTLVDFVVRNGKLNDEGGELAARDYKAYGRAIVSSKGLSLDGMAELAHEQGYIAERDPQLLLDMLDRELKDDQPVFSRFQSDEQQAEQVRAEELNLLDEYLIMEGIDIQNMTNEQVRKAMSERRTFEQTDDQALKDLTDLVVATLGSDKLAESYASDLMKLEKMIPRVSDEQDFGDLKFTDRINFKGLPGTRKRSAQKQFDIAVKKRNSLKKLLDCMNASK